MERRPRPGLDAGCRYRAGSDRRRRRRRGTLRRSRHGRLAVQTRQLRPAPGEEKPPRRAGLDRGQRVLQPRRPRHGQLQPAPAQPRWSDADADGLQRGTRHHRGPRRCHLAGRKRRCHRWPRRAGQPPPPPLRPRPQYLPAAAVDGGCALPQPGRVCRGHLACRRGQACHCRPARRPRAGDRRAHHTRQDGPAQPHRRQQPHRNPHRRLHPLRAGPGRSAGHLVRRPGPDRTHARLLGTVLARHGPGRHAQRLRGGGDGKDHPA